MTKRLAALFLVAVFLFSFSMTANAVPLNEGIKTLRTCFLPGEGPVDGKYSIDYRYFSPVGENDTAKYPLVVWLHGLGDGSKEGAPAQKSNIAFWASDEFQSRFGDADGAFIIAARSREELGVFWSNDLLAPLKSAIVDFIAKNKDNIDLSRIYIGGYSLGGKMTLKMITAYPEMFAAAFPICPAWAPSEEFVSYIKDIPVWITSSTRDPLVNYFLAVLPTWEKIAGISSVPGECRFSTLRKVCYHDGKKTDSSHHAWFSVNYDMFTENNEDYYHMSTVNGLGETVKLTYPDGMISWLYSHTSDWDGTAPSGNGNIKQGDKTDNMVAFDSVGDFLKLIWNALKYIFSGNI